MKTPNPVLEALAEALLGSDDGVTAVATCPCGALIFLYQTDGVKHADHELPLCAEWAAYYENWVDPKRPPVDGMNRRPAP